MNKVRSLAILFAVAAVGTFALAACGGDDSGGSTATKAPGGQGTQSAAASGAATKTAAPGGATTEAATATQQSNGGGDVSDPCSLLTQSEVEAALGENVDTPKSITAPSVPVSGSITANVANCSYSSPTTVHSIDIDVWSAQGSDAAIKQMTQYICASKESVSGLGDVACWYSADHGELQLSKGSVFLDLHASSTGDTTEMLKALAQKAVDRLP